MKKIVVAAGGTGGHLYPAIAVVEELLKEYKEDIEFVFIGSKNKIEGRVVPELGYRFQHLDIEGIRSFFSLSTILLPFKILKAQATMAKILSEEKPDLVLCAGAYISYPVGIAAYKKSIPLFLLESNVQPGKTNKLLAKKATKVFTSYKESKKFLSIRKDKCIVVGNPVRNTFTQSPSKVASIQSFGLDPSKKTILVFGGSLGANSINTAVIEQLLPMIEENDIQLIWQTGSNFVVPTTLPKGVKALPFITDMASAYDAATMVVCRAGATSLSELSLVKKPAILIPYPFAAYNHQHSNAMAYVSKNAAVILEDSKLAEAFQQTVLELLKNEKLQKQLSLNISKLATPNAAKDVVTVLLKYLQ